MKSYLIEGDPMEPEGYDLIAQIETLSVGGVPKGDGWRVLTGSTLMNTWGRVVMRYEAEEEA